MRVFDTHCHPQHPDFDRDRDETIRRALDADIGIICVGTDAETSQQAIDLAERFEELWASVGLHPNDNLSERYDQSIYKEMAAHPKVVAIGEVGLDYYRTTDDAKKKFQRERFERQLGLALELKKPLIIHCRDAHADMIDILTPHRGKLTGIVHSFTGTYADAKKYIGLGFYIGLNGIITFARQYDDTVMQIPLEHILLETDAPYLSPEPYRGRRNEPVNVLNVGEQIALLRRVQPEQIFTQTTKNARSLFNI